MNCEILHTLYVRSNGDVPCNDDAGENVLLGRIASQNARWTPQSLFSNHRYRHIREQLASGNMPWPTVCRGCAFFRPNEAFADPLAQKLIRKIQIEASLACRLRCPGCSNRFQVQIRPQPFHMDLALFERLLGTLRSEDYAVDEIEYCGQGEPLQHPRFPEFVRLARAHFPATRQRLITSGNFAFATATAGERLDEIMVSCDGAGQESYEQYRIGGRFERPIQFMRDALRAEPGRPGALVWKYILFEWNDSPEEIRRAQELAAELGVHAILFVFTHSKGKSRRFTPENVAEFPVHFPNVVTNATPIHYQHSDTPASLERALSEIEAVV